MQQLYPFLVSFILIFLSELGDKTQILVLSFSAKNKTISILIGVALGTLFSHGLAIMFGSGIGLLENENFIIILKLLTYMTFLLFGIVGLIKIKKEKSQEENKEDSKSHIIKIITALLKNTILIVALTIAIGELGDKTFLASIGLGVEYPHYKISLILGAILGMVVSDSIAIFFGKLLGTKISTKTIELLSNIIFIIFGIIGILGILF